MYIFYVHGSVHRDSMSMIVQQDGTIYSFIIFLQTALHVSDDILIHHRGHTQTVITTSGTGRTVFATVHCRAAGSTTQNKAVITNNSTTIGLFTTDTSDKNLQPK